MNRHIRTGALRASAVMKVLGGMALSTMVCAQRAQGQLVPILDSSDTAIAIDLDAVPVAPMNNGRYPAAESPAKAIDGLVSIPGPPPSFSKYLNFGGAGSGFIVTPFAAIPVDGFQITTANDAPGRDPASYELYGFNGALITTDSGPSPAINQTGLAEAWTLISSGPVALPGDPAIGNDQRGVVGPMVAVGSSTGYQHYKMIFPTIKRPSDSIMQMAEVQFFADHGNPSSAFLQPGNSIIAVDQIPTPAGWSGSSYPSTDNPPRAIDQISSTKYLNFGEQRSGIIITNSGGPVKVEELGLTTADNSVERDPASYELWGTNDTIRSEDNSNSNGSEGWKLISSGRLALPGILPNGGGDDFRGVASLIPINAESAYASYRLIFPTVKDASTANSMQIADIQFYAESTGDYNGDGTVDAADYVVWRKTDGTPAGYNVWRSHFGQTAGSGSSTVANAAIPEPSTLLMLVLAAAGVSSRRRRSA